jgi:uncharacterized phage protein gp47/JayE
MAWQTITLSGWKDLIKQDFNARMPGADSFLAVNAVNITATVLAGLAYTLQGFINTVARLSHPATSEGQWLVDWGDVVGVPQKGATQSEGSIVVTGVDGSVIDADLFILRGSHLFRTIGPSVAIEGGSAHVTVRSEDKGADLNTPAGVKMVFQAPPEGIKPEVTVAAGGLVGGADLEDTESYRARIFDEFQNPPHGGNEADYRRWALEVPGVTRAWVKGKSPSPGAVTVFFMMDEVRAAFKGLPQGSNAYPFSGDQALVWNHIEEFRPVTAQVFTIGPTPAFFPIVIKGLDPDTPDVRAAIYAELDDLFFRMGEPGGTIPLSTIWEAVSLAVGERRHLIQSPVADIVCPPGSIPLLGAVTYIA